MDKNTEIEQYFALWNESFPVAATHDHWVRWGKLLRVWLPSIDGVPMNIEVTGDFPRALNKWTSLELELRLLFLKGSFYKDEEEYYEKKSRIWRRNRTSRAVHSARRTIRSLSKARRCL